MTKAVYFLSDFHLGAPTYEKSLEREKIVVEWLKQIKSHCKALYLLGDVFDFWFEYKHTAPKNYVRLLGTLAQMADDGIPIHYFTGNHDMWMFGYLEKEIGLKLYHEPIYIEINGLLLHIGHGDGLGPGDFGFKFIKKVFRNPVCQWFFARLHPNLAFGMAHFWSKKSRNHNTENEQFLGEAEWLVQYCRKILQKKHIDLFIFGHRHCPTIYNLTNKSQYVNLGDWINHYTYGVLEENNFWLGSYAHMGSLAK